LPSRWLPRLCSGATGREGEIAPLLLLPWPPPWMGGEFPLWSMAAMASEGQEPLLDWISLFVLFCFAFLFSGLSPFLKFPEIRNSDCAEILTRFFPDISFLAPEEEPQPAYGVPTRHHRAPGGGARAQVARGGCGPQFVMIPPPKNHIYSKIILRKNLLHLDFI
jgi:hypothetical protein